MTASSPVAQAWRVRALVLALCLLAFTLRVYRLGDQELRGDEGFSVHLVRDGAGAAFARILATGEPTQPLVVLALAAARGLWGASEFALRFPSVLAGVLAVPLGFWLGRRLLVAEAGLWAALLLAINPFLVWYGQDVRLQYPVMLLFTLLAAVLLWQALSAPSGQASGRRWALYALAVALGVYVHYYAALVVVAHGLWIVLARRDRLWPFALALLGAGLLVLPWAVPHIQSIAAYGPTYGGGQLPPSELAGRVAGALAWGDFLQAPVAGVLFWAVVLAGGLALAWRRDRLAALWLGIVATVPIVLALLIAQRRTLFNEGYTLSALPALLILAGGIVAARPALRAVGVALVAVLFVALGNYYFDPRYSRTIGWRELGARVAAETTARDVVIANYPDPTLYYYVRGPAETVVLPPAPDADPATVAEVLDRVAERGGRAWFLPSSWDARGLVRSYLDAGWLLVDEGWAGQQHLFVYAPPARVREDALPAGAVLGGEIRLGAYLVRPQAAAGDRLYLILFWEALGPVAHDYTVFTHLLAPDGSVAAQRDNPPAGGLRPTSGWRPGEVVTDSYVLELPAGLSPGDYTLQTGLYDPATGTRLPVAGGGDAVRLAAVRVH